MTALFWAFMIFLAVSWLAVATSWLMFPDRPKSKAWMAFSAVIVVTGIGTAVTLAQV